MCKMWKVCQNVLFGQAVWFGKKCPDNIPPIICPPLAPDFGCPIYTPRVYDLGVEVNYHNEVCAAPERQICVLVCQAGGLHTLAVTQVVVGAYVLPVTCRASTFWRRAISHNLDNVIVKLRGKCLCICGWFAQMSTLTTCAFAQINDFLHPTHFGLTHPCFFNAVLSFFRVRLCRVYLCFVLGTLNSHSWFLVTFLWFVLCYKKLPNLAPLCNFPHFSTENGVDWVLMQIISKPEMRHSQKKLHTLSFSHTHSLMTCTGSSVSPLRNIRSATKKKPGGEVDFCRK